MASLMDRAPKAAQKLQSKGGECNKLYVPELRSINFWIFFREVTGINATIVKTFLMQPSRLHFLYI